ncbi:hypothetical protein D3C72_1674940 [compost metagenome]
MTIATRDAVVLAGAEIPAGTLHDFGATPYCAVGKAERLHAEAFPGVLRIGRSHAADEQEMPIGKLDHQIAGLIEAIRRSHEMEIVRIDASCELHDVELAQRVVITDADVTAAIDQVGVAPGSTDQIYTAVAQVACIERVMAGFAK